MVCLVVFIDEIGLGGERLSDSPFRVVQETYQHAHSGNKRKDLENSPEVEEDGSDEHRDKCLLRLMRLLRKPLQLFSPYYLRFRLVPQMTMPNSSMC